MNKTRITKITLKNFQAHKATTIELQDGLNIITGPSDKGKSSIIRALKWVFFDRPRGADFRSFSCSDKDSVEVTVYFSDGNVVKKIRRGSKTLYQVNGQEYKALRGTVPEEVQKICGISEVNFQEQLRSSYFLLEDSPGAVTQKLNQLSGLEDMHIALTKVNSIINSIKTSLNSVDTELDEIDIQLDQLDWVDDLEVKFKDFEQKYRTYQQLSDLYLRLLDYIQDFINNKSLRQKLKSIVDSSPSLDEVEVLIQKVHNLNNEIHKLSLIVEQYIEFKGKLTKAKQIDSVNYRKSIQGYLSLLSTYATLGQQYNNLDKLVQNYITTRKQRLDQSQQLNQYKEEFHSLLKKAGKCPICSSKI